MMPLNTVSEKENSSHVYYEYLSFQSLSWWLAEVNISLASPRLGLDRGQLIHEVKCFQLRICHYGLPTLCSGLGSSAWYCYVSYFVSFALMLVDAFCGGVCATATALRELGVSDRSVLAWGESRLWDMQLATFLPCDIGVWSVSDSECSWLTAGS